MRPDATTQLLEQLLAPDHSLIPPGLRERAGYGLLLYGLMALLGLSMLGKPHWGIGMALVGVVPWLMMSYPVIFGGLLPLGLWLIFRRYGWRHSIAFGLAAVLFMAVLVGRIQANGYDFGLAFLDAIRITFWLLILTTLFLWLLRLIVGRNRLEYLTGHGWTGESHRAAQRQEVKAVKARGGARLKRIARRVRHGEPYRPAHARPRNGRPGDGDTVVHDPDDLDPGHDQPPRLYDVEGDTETTIDGVPLSEWEYGGQAPRRFWHGGAS